MKLTTPINLYFDKVIKDKHGQTEDYKKIMYNLELIDKSWAEIYLETIQKANNASIILPAGKFLCLVTLTIENGLQCAMILMNLMDDKRMEDYYIEKSKIDKQHKEFRYTLNQIRAQKHKWKKFKLVAGELPLTKENIQIKN
jgi:hypothetical protein